MTMAKYPDDLVTIRISCNSTSESYPQETISQLKCVLYDNGQTHLVKRREHYVSCSLVCEGDIIGTWP